MILIFYVATCYIIAFFMAVVLTVFNQNWYKTKREDECSEIAMILLVAPLSFPIVLTFFIVTTAIESPIWIGNLIRKHANKHLKDYILKEIK